MIKISIFTTLLVAFILLLFVFATTNRPEELTAKLLPTGSITAEASYLGGDPEAERISQKFGAAIHFNRAWFENHLEQLDLAPGEPLP